MANFTQKRLDELLEYWQGALFLNDWDIDVRIAREKDMCQNDSQGVVQYCYVGKSATIEIMDETDFPTECLGGRVQDQERTLVHELLHLRFCVVTDVDEVGTGLTKDEHQLINDMARALIYAKRGRLS